MIRIYLYIFIGHFEIFYGHFGYFMTIWNIFCSFGTFWYHVQRKIWQPCCCLLQTHNKKADLRLSCFFPYVLFGHDFAAC
jgi:hypothetical protein